MWDTRASRDLLAELPDTAPDIVAALPEIDEAAEHDEPAAHELNKQLRGLLARAVHELPDDGEGDDVARPPRRSICAADRRPIPRSTDRRAPAE